MMPVMTSLLGDSLTTASTTITGELTAALPIAMGIGATILAICLGWKFFKRLAK